MRSHNYSPTHCLLEKNPGLFLLRVLQLIGRARWGFFQKRIIVVSNESRRNAWHLTPKTCVRILLKRFIRATWPQVLKRKARGKGGNKYLPYWRALVITSLVLFSCLWDYWGLWTTMYASDMCRSCSVRSLAAILSGLIDIMFVGGLGSGHA